MLTNGNLDGRRTRVSLDFLAGQVVGKAWMVLLSIPFVAWFRRRGGRD
jgi:hypothetical protein